MAVCAIQTPGVDVGGEGGEVAEHHVGDKWVEQDPHKRVDQTWNNTEKIIITQRKLPNFLKQNLGYWASHIISY